MFRDNSTTVRATATGTGTGATFALTALGLTADEAKSVTGATVLNVAAKTTEVAVAKTGVKAVITGANLVITRQGSPSDGDIYTVMLHVGQIPVASVASA